MSKMGISTYQSYCGAQIFDAVGLKSDFVDEFFFGTATRIEGVGLDADRRGDRTPPSRRVRRRRRSCATRSRSAANICFRMRGEAHVWSPETVSRPAARGARQFLRQVPRLRRASINDQSEQLMTMRGLFRIKIGRGRRPQADAARGGRAGARTSSSDSRPARCRFGSISREAHTTLAIAMNRIGGKSNTGEGGEEAGPLQAAAEWRFDALGDQAGRLGPLRRHDRIPRQFRHDADQDGAGRQARRRRPAARPQGRRDDRQGAPLDARRRPDLAAAAPRHLFDRGSGAAHLRPEERQSGRRRLGEARLRSRRRHGRGRRVARRAPIT